MTPFHGRKERLLPLRGPILVELRLFLSTDLPHVGRPPEPDDYLLYPVKKVYDGRGAEGEQKLAFRAYQKSREGKGPEPTIDGLTPEQQFFIAWGQWRGDETRPETQRTMVQGDPHPVAKYRVNGPLSNLPAFRDAFQCKADAPMVRPPATRCEIW